MKTKNSIMKQTIIRIEKEKKDLKLAEDIINLLQKDVDNLANTDTLGIYQFDQLIKGKKIFLESILEHIKKLV